MLAIMWEAAKNEPYTILGFVGVAIAWIWKILIDRRQRQDDEKRLADSRSVEIGDIVHNADFILDRYDTLQLERERRMNKRNEILEKAGQGDDPIVRKSYEAFARNSEKLNEFRLQISQVDVRDSSHENYLTAKRLHHFAKRLEAMAIENNEVMRKFEIGDDNP